MAYRAVDESEIAIDAPITNSLVTAIRDNLEAIRTGDSTAPRTTAGNPSSDSVLSIDIFKRDTPSPGVYCIWQASAVADQDDTDAIQVVIKTAGQYRYRINARCGTSERTGGGDTTPPLGQANVNVNRTVGATTTTILSRTVYSQQSSDSGGNPVLTELRLDFEISTQAVGEIITIHIDEVNNLDGEHAQVSVALQVGTSDSEAMYGVDVRGLNT